MSNSSLIFKGSRCKVLSIKHCLTKGVDTRIFGALSKGQQLVYSNCYVWTSWEWVKCSKTAPANVQIQTKSQVFESAQAPIHVGRSLVGFPKLPWPRCFSRSHSVLSWILRHRNMFKNLAPSHYSSCHDSHLVTDIKWVCWVQSPSSFTHHHI